MTKGVITGLKKTGEKGKIKEKKAKSKIPKTVERTRMQEMDQNDKRGVGRSRVQNQTEKTGLENGENEKNEKKAKKTGF